MMHFDDRLATVLRQPAGGEVAARIQYRQLLDLLGTMPTDRQDEATDAASLRLAELAAEIDAPTRAAMLRDKGLRLRNPRLVALLAEGGPAVASAALEAAELDEEQWLDLAPALPVAARGHLRARRDLGPKVEALLTRLGIFARGLPPAKAAPGKPKRKTDTRQRGEDTGPNGIGALVRRIDEFRKSRQPLEADFAHADAPRLPLDDLADMPQAKPVSAFDFTTDAQLRIEWCSRDMAPMAAGMSLSRSGLVHLLLQRQPLAAARIEIEGASAISGVWQIDASPRFDRKDGHFTGYAGRMRRLTPAEQAPALSMPDTGEADRMRQLLHELKTPVNAVQGFAEVIQQQLFGPVPHGYRALAASIASDAATMLAGFDELERLARLDTGSLELEQGTCRFADVLEMTVARLLPFVEARGGNLTLRCRGRLETTLAKPEAELLAWRLLSALAGSANPGERLDIEGTAEAGKVEVRIAIPPSLASALEDGSVSALVSNARRALSPGSFGTGFALRLATAEARSAGGSLDHRGQAMVLVLPGLTGAASNHSLAEGSQ